MANVQKLIKGLTGEFTKNPSVVAFILVGSQVSGSAYEATENSDMEAYVITKDADALEIEKGLPDLVAKFGKVLFCFRHQIGFVAVFDDLFRLELPVVKQSEIKSLFSRPKAQVVQVLFDRTNGQIEQILSNRPETLDYSSLFADKIVNFWYWQIVAVQYFIKGEIYNTRAVLNIHASALIKLFELLNNPGILLLETNKRIEKFLSEDRLRLLREISPAYDSLKIKQALIKVMDVFPQVAEMVKTKYGYSYDESIEEKVKPLLLKFLRQTC